MKFLESRVQLACSIGDFTRETGPIQVIPTRMLWALRTALLPQSTVLMKIRTTLLNSTQKTCKLYNYNEQTSLSPLQENLAATLHPDTELYK